MRNFKNKLYKRVAVYAATLVFSLSGCSLDEDVYSVFTEDSFYKTDAEILSSLSGVYRNFASITSMGTEYRVLELSADQVVLHGKIQGWWKTNETEQLMEHKWDENNAYLNTAWNTFFATVGQTNALIPILRESSLESAKGAVAELRVLRAYAYFFLMDLFGNVPIYLEPRVDPKNLPTQNTRVEVFNFVVSELKEALEDLPSQTTVGAGYYGRFTKEAAYALLATVYLNGEVYAGTAYNDDAVTYADLVINSGAYSLLPNYFDNFKHDNDMNKEFIFGGIYSPTIPGGIGHPLVQKVLPGIGFRVGTTGLFGLPYTPQNGFGTRPSIVALYEDQDARKSMFLTPGELKDPRTGETVMVERIVPDNNSTLYAPGISSVGPVPYVIIPATGIRDQPMNAGEKWIKWGLDPNTNGGNAGNDIAFIRYADVLLIKAEALARDGDFPGALPLVNEIRERSNASPLAVVTLDDILDERGRELVFEMSRRRDLIRFGKFTDPWEFKGESESFRSLYPIPRIARDANTNLDQNDGY